MIKLLIIAFLFSSCAGMVYDRKTDTWTVPEKEFKCVCIYPCTKEKK